jgi:hypothetical protein
MASSFIETWPGLIRSIMNATWRHVVNVKAMPFERQIIYSSEVFIGSTQYQESWLMTLVALL